MSEHPMAHASNAHQVRPLSTMTPRRRPFDWPLVQRLPIMARSTLLHNEAGYTTAPTPSPVVVITRLTPGGVHIR